jgi:hypothetical protein
MNACGESPGRIGRLLRWLVPWRRKERCGDFFPFEGQPPDSFVREPRRPHPKAPGGSIALDLPPDTW